MGYLHYKRSETDRRSVRVSLTEKGKEACDVVRSSTSASSARSRPSARSSEDDVRGLNRALVRLERFWSDQIRYRL